MEDHGSRIAAGLIEDRQEALCVVVGDEMLVVAPQRCHRGVGMSSDAWLDQLCVFRVRPEAARERHRKLRDLAASRPLGELAVGGHLHHSTLQVHTRPTRQRGATEHHLVLQHPTADRGDRDQADQCDRAPGQPVAIHPRASTDEHDKPDRMEHRANHDDRRTGDDHRNQRESRRTRLTDNEPDHSDQPERGHHLVRWLGQVGQHLRVSHGYERTADGQPTVGRQPKEERCQHRHRGHRQRQQQQLQADRIRKRRPPHHDAECQVPQRRLHVQVPDAAERIVTKRGPRHELPADIEKIRREPLTRRPQPDVQRCPCGRRRGYGMPAKRHCRRVAGWGAMLTTTASALATVRVTAAVGPPSRVIAATIIEPYSATVYRARSGCRAATYNC